MLTLRQLRYLDAIARHLHFGRAAKECCVSQPALSMQIKELENHLGVALIERRKSGVALTRQGEEIVARGRHILNAVGELTEFARHRGRLLSGELRLGVIPTIGPYLLPRILPELKHRFPELDLKVRETQTQPLISELKDGVLDVVLLALPLQDRELSFKELYDDRFLLAVARSKIADKKASASQIIASEELLLLEEGHCLRDQALAYCRAASQETLSSFGATSLTTLVQMVANGFGITLVPEMAVPVEAARMPQLELIRFPDPEPKRIIGLAWRTSSPRRADYEALGNLLAGLH